MNKISVSTLVFYLKNKLDNDQNLSSVYVSGELSNFKYASSGHLYFTLKDNKASISCVMFRSSASKLNFIPKNGDKVLVSGYVSLFETSGQVQLYVNNLSLDGLGDLYRQYEELKNKLASEGFFDDFHKKENKFLYPSNIAVLTGKDSAAMSDIKIQFKRRWPLANVDYYPILVQGVDAPSNIIKTLLKVDKLDYEIIVLARGGGSFEDLFCFNDENLVKTIYNLNTFIISGIGHEQDFTLCDFVCDQRAPTPTAAVELITPNIKDINDYLDLLPSKMKNSVKNKLNKCQSGFNLYKNNKYLKNGNLLIEKENLKLDYYRQKLLNFSSQINTINIKIDNYKLLLDTKISNIINNSKKEIDTYENLLKAYSVDNILKRGFSITYKNGKLIKDSKSLKVDDEVDIKMIDGIKKARIIKNG